MTILDKLMEKKDLETYIAHRIDHLSEQKGKIPEHTPPEKRELARKQVQGRIEELKHIRYLLAQGRLKEASKQHWNEVQDRDE